MRTLRGLPVMLARTGAKAHERTLSETLHADPTDLKARLQARPSSATARRWGGDPILPSSARQTEGSRRDRAHLRLGRTRDLVRPREAPAGTGTSEDLGLNG